MNEPTLKRFLPTIPIWLLTVCPGLSCLCLFSSPPPPPAPSLFSLSLLSVCLSFSVCLFASPSSLFPALTVSIIDLLSKLIRSSFLSRLSVCLCLSLSISVYLSVCLSLCLSVYLSLSFILISSSNCAFGRFLTKCIMTVVH